MTNNRQRQQQLNYASEYEIVSVLAFGEEARRIYRKKTVNGRKQNSYTEKIEMLKVAWRPTWYEVSLLDSKQKAMIKQANMTVVGPIEGSRELFSEDTMWLIKKRDGSMWQVNYGHLKREFEHELLAYYEKRLDLEIDETSPSPLPELVMEELEERINSTKQMDSPILEKVTTEDELFITPDEVVLSEEFETPCSSSSSLENDENLPIDEEMQIETKDFNTSGSVTPCDSPIDRPRRSAQTPVRFLDN